MSIKINKCIKVILNKCFNKDIKEVKQIIRDFNYVSCKASNKATRMWYYHTLDIIKMKNENKEFNQKQYELDTFGKGYQNVIEGKMKEMMPLVNTGNVGTLHQQLVMNNWKTSKEDVLKYKGQFPQYKLDTPFCIKNNCFKLRNNGGWLVDITFFSDPGLKEFGFKRGHKFEFGIDKIDNNKKSTITKIINGEYKQGSAQLSISKKDKIELTISFGFDKDIDKPLDSNRTLGIDLGIVNVAAMSIWDNNRECWDFMKYKESMISGLELIKFRQKYDAIRKNMGIASKIVGEGRVGHGYKTRMKPLDKIKDRVANFSDTYNHKVSKYIVEFAVKNNCGIIQMEDLSGVTADVKEKFLKQWSYYDLQSKIEYKAKEYGIDVRKIDPKYTSKRCSQCRCIHIENRNCKESQSKFKCKICGYEENADVNASRNISIPYIDEIIKNTEVQGLNKAS